MASSSSSSNNDNDNKNEVLTGACFCGLTRFTVTGGSSSLLLSALCHCSRCTTMNGAVSVWTTHWREDSVNWTGEPVTYEAVKGVKWRYRCRECGTPLGSWNKEKKKWSIWASAFQRDQTTKKLDIPHWLQPTAHQFYETRILEMDVYTGDITAMKLPKYKGYEGKSERIG